MPTILLVHLGAQYATLIRLRLSELGINVLFIKSSTVPDQLPTGIRGVILSGGPGSADVQTSELINKISKWGVPILGICLGHQALAHYYGGKVSQHGNSEYGRASLHVTGSSPLLKGIGQDLTVWVSHGDTVEEMPSGWKLTASTAECVYAAMEDSTGQIFGVQFHPEVTQTQGGVQILRNFAVDICQAPQDFLAENLIDQIIKSIQEHVGVDGHLMLAWSTGVDSTTFALLAQKALGADRVHPIFVDNGFQRQEDLDLAHTAHSFLPNLQVIDARERFLTALAGETDPEKKRHIVGTMFWVVFTEVGNDLKQKYGKLKYGQGTLGPDVIESGAEDEKAKTIKTHHNIVKPPPEFKLEILEPLKELFKPQVRAMGRAIGVPEYNLTKHPFPGPGLAVRIKGAVTPERLEVARHCDAIYMAELRRAGFYDTVSQAGAAVLQDTCVCVRGDVKYEGALVVLFAVTTEDFMTADIAQLPVSFLTDVGDQITRRVKGVGAVLYKVTRKPPSTIELE